MIGFENSTYDTQSFAQSPTLSSKAIEVLFLTQAFVVKRIAGDGSNTDGKHKLGQITWSKFGGPGNSWQLAKSRANFNAWFDAPIETHRLPHELQGLQMCGMIYLIQASLGSLAVVAFVSILGIYMDLQDFTRGWAYTCLVWMNLLKNSGAGHA